MNIEKKTEMSVKLIPDIKNSSYELNRYEINDLNNSADVLQLNVDYGRECDWESSSELFLNYLNSNHASKEDIIYAFVVIPSWKKDSRISRYHGVGYDVNKGYSEKITDFILEGHVVDSGDIIFYGVVELTKGNISHLFDYIASFECGILFSGSWKNNNLIDELSSILVRDRKTSTFHLDLIKAIDIILDKNSNAILPYCWGEVGDYYVDIFIG